MNKQLQLTLDKVGESPWYNGYHIHPSLFGYSDRSIKRLVEIAAAVRLRMVRSHKEWQSWILLDFDKPECDGVFIHTPNPHSSTFPIIISKGRVPRYGYPYKKYIAEFAAYGYSAFKASRYKSIVAQYSGLTNR